MRLKSVFSILLVAFLMIACMTYHQKNSDFFDRFELGQIEEAANILDKNEEASNGKSRFIYFLDHGVTSHIAGNYEESNEYFEKAYIFGEDYQRNYANEAAQYLLNPNIIVYKGEDHEHLLLHYYKALNYLYLKKPEEALVECRRMDLRLKSLQDKYKSDSKFKRDAFVHNLMGIIYDSRGDVNNAFIAYRNAYEIYKLDYKEMFGMQVPHQLKKDLIRTAAQNGFITEQDQYEREFDMKHVPQNPSAELVFFWNNGLGPVKGEWSVNFTVIRGSGGVVTFANEELGLSFPFFYSSGDNSNSLTDLEFIRVVFPRYIERTPLYHSAILSNDEDISYPLDRAESVNDIAFKSLQQRMILEFGKSLLRVAIKKSAEYALRKENEGLGFLLGAFNAATEQADTRNWQTLPNSIYYARLPLKQGQNHITLQLDGNGQKEFDFIYEAKKGQTIFHAFRTLDTSKP